MTGAFPTEALTTWVDRSVSASEHGEVCEENLRALLRDMYVPAEAWPLAVTCFSSVLARVANARSSLRSKLIVPLRPRLHLETRPPKAADVQGDVHRKLAPSLVIHAPIPQREWEPEEEYRRPLTWSPFVGQAGASGAEGLYIAFRDQWEIEEHGPYRRQLLFEHVQAGPSSPR